MFLAMITLMVYPVSAFAAEGPAAPDLQIGLDTAFTFLAFILVFFMQAGFAMLEMRFGPDEECGPRSW